MCSSISAVRSWQQQLWHITAGCCLAISTSGLQVEHTAVHFITAGNGLPGTGVSIPRGNHSNRPKSSGFASQYCDTSAEAKAGEGWARAGGHSTGTPSPALWGTAGAEPPPDSLVRGETGEPMGPSAIRGEQEKTLQGEGLDHVGRQLPSGIIFWNG